MSFFSPIFSVVIHDLERGNKSPSVRCVVAYPPFGIFAVGNLTSCLSYLL